MRLLISNSGGAIVLVAAGDGAVVLKLLGEAGVCCFWTMPWGLLESWLGMPRSEARSAEGCESGRGSVVIVVVSCLGELLRWRSVCLRSGS